jgi:hypothetical protein
MKTSNRLPTLIYSGMTWSLFLSVSLSLEKTPFGEVAYVGTDAVRAAPET